jgi:hypothetical protein
MNTILCALTILGVLALGFALVALGNWVQAMMRWHAIHGQLIADLDQRLANLETRE